MSIARSNSQSAGSLQIFAEVSLGQPIGQLRAVPVRLGSGGQPAVLAVYCANFDVDPYVEMFFFPTDTLKLALLTVDGKRLWQRDLGRGVVPGMWFCPVLAMDLDGDGVDEIFFVNNTDPQHPLGVRNYVLERLDARTGKTTGQWPWPDGGGSQALSHQFRNFIVGGQVRDNDQSRPVLVTAQGTYESMFLQGWNADLSPRWTHTIDKAAPGARGSHQCPIVDFDRDGSDELMWGERNIRLLDGRETFCADRDRYCGHSDVIQPVLAPDGRWFFYTCRESDNRADVRVALFDHTGNRVWGALDHGHMDMGWVARLGDNREHVAMAIRIGHKVCGPDGRFHTGMEEFTWNALTGEPVKLPFSIYRTVPVDFDGDGRHELVRGIASGNGEVINRHGHVIAQLGAPVAMASQFAGRPGEQVLAYYPDGMLRIWGDPRAEDTDFAGARVAHPFYIANQRLTSSGSNLGVVAGV